MDKFKKYKNRIEAFLHSDGGQYFFNIAYSVGAAIVIWGALFKILHLPGGNTLLCIGMGTEIAMFLLTAFDRPPKEPNWEEIVPALTGQGGQSVQRITDENGEPIQIEGGKVHHGKGVVAPQLVGGLTIVDDSGQDITQSVEMMTQATGNLNKAAELAEATNRFVEAVQDISKQMEDLHAVMATGSTGYAEQMADLNRNLAGLNTIYEIQLKNVSGQLDAIDKVNKGLKDIRDMYEKSASESAQYCEETEKMTKYMKQINAVYAKMITAMTINMHQPLNPVANGINPFAAAEESEN
ncbi:MAG: gliding motility protein GldL [Muribaculaceae bacterium]|nr:gliding motility protein GldL [Muribaculaceae bacterium]